PPLLLLLARRPPMSTPLPYTTLFRSVALPRTEGVVRAVAVLAQLPHAVAAHRAAARRRAGVRAACTVVAVALLAAGPDAVAADRDRKSTRLNSSHDQISYAVFCLKKK